MKKPTIIAGSILPFLLSVAPAVACGTLKDGRAYQETFDSLTTIVVAGLVIGVVVIVGAVWSSRERPSLTSL